MREAGIGLALLALVVGCGGGSDSPASGDKKPIAPVAKDAKPWDPALGTCTIEGRVYFKGEPPRRRPLDMAAEAKCSGQHAEPALDESLIVGPDAGMANVFVWVKEGLEKWTFPVPGEPVVLGQKGCVYRPHVVGVQTGQPFTIQNGDAVLHNVHGFPESNASFNFGQNGVGTTDTVTFDASEVMVKVKCDVHGWMSAYIGAVRHPFFTVTGEAGTFRLTGLPPGEYEIEGWHEIFQGQSKKITLAEGETKSLEFSFEED